MCEKPAQEEGRLKASKPGPPMGLTSPSFYSQALEASASNAPAPRGGHCHRSWPIPRATGLQSPRQHGTSGPGFLGEALLGEARVAATPRSLME